jgi:hypothetical protein
MSRAITSLTDIPGLNKDNRNKLIDSRAKRQIWYWLY